MTVRICQGKSFFSDVFGDLTCDDAWVPLTNHKFIPRFRFGQFGEMTDFYVDIDNWEEIVKNAEVEQIKRAAGIR
jgi:hypothetical protein